MVDNVNHPVHYNEDTSGIECWDACRELSAGVFNCIKYVWRHQLKNGVEDIKKALWYARKADLPKEWEFSPHTWTVLSLVHKRTDNLALKQMLGILIAVAVVERQQAVIAALEQRLAEY